MTVCCSAVPRTAGLLCIHAKHALAGAVSRGYSPAPRRFVRERRTMSQLNTLQAKLKLAVEALRELREEADKLADRVEALERREVTHG